MINGYAHINFLQINIVLHSAFKRAHGDLSGCLVNPVVVGEKGTEAIQNRTKRH
jgi:hypothetical protein